MGMPHQGDFKRFTHCSGISEREVPWHKITMSPSQRDGVRAANEKILQQPLWQSCANSLRPTRVSLASSGPSRVPDSFSYNQI